MSKYLKDLEDNHPLCSTCPLYNLCLSHTMDSAKCPLVLAVQAVEIIENQFDGLY